MFLGTFSLLTAQNKELCLTFGVSTIAGEESDKILEALRTLDEI